MFINFYNTTQDVSINSYRTARGYANSDVLGLIEDIIEGRRGSCPLDGAKDALEDGECLADLREKHGDDTVQNVVERLHAMIECHES